MIHYGFQRMALLNSAGYRRAELPLDASVSLIAPNNAGKTSLINALQFLLIIDKRRMDFGAHDVDTSRRFYFPNNGAYILLEVALPTTGTVVLGCVGKGVSHDYEYFAYKGDLKLDDYRLPDGTQVQQPQLKAHMASIGKLVFSYTSGEFASALYGTRRRILDQEPDFTVFKLEHASHADAFQRVLTRTLRLDKLRSSEVKDYLLAIFRRDLPDSSIDFKAEWDKAFSEVNADRAQYLATVRQQASIDVMERQQLKRLEVRGKLLYFRPLIDRRLQEWETHFKERGNGLRDAIADVETQQANLQLKDRQLNERKLEAVRQRQQLLDVQHRQDTLETEFALIADKSILDDALADERRSLEKQTALLQNASTRGIDAIRRDIQAAESERKQLKRELATLTDNLYLHLKTLLSPQQLDTLNRTLSQQVMTLASDDFTTDPVELKLWLETDQAATSGTLTLSGLRLSVQGLSPQHTQRSHDEIQQRLDELMQLLVGLELQIKAAQDLDASRREKDRLDASVRQIETQIQRFNELHVLKTDHGARTARITELENTLSILDADLDNSVMSAKNLREKERELQCQLDALGNDHINITRLRENRRDNDQMFENLADLSHQRWLGTDEVGLTQLSESLSVYHRECADLIALDRDLDAGLAKLHMGGLTKFQFVAGSETEINRIIEFAAHLSQEEQALDRKSRSAVVNVTACLRELRDGLVTFKSKMRDFNRLINRRQLSDLSVFKIEPVDETQMVEAIEQLISTAEKAESGETFELFNHGTVLDDATLNRAKSLLIHEGEVRGCLRVEHFFRLEFIVGKAGRKEESFSDIDSAASNGTVLMAKLVTGLALLHLMQDKRYQVQAVCYLDEASALDQRNQRSLIDTAQDFGYALIFASPAPLVTARYCVPITSSEGYNIISQKNWQILEPLDEIATPTAGSQAFRVGLMESAQASA
ncbi:MAG TPA: hypothetical protein PLL01_01860 [Rhodoferax sp.]|nr:hypothetical protein [Rhodoferax sp.]